MASGKKYDGETKARAVRMFLDRVAEGDAGVGQAYDETAALLGINRDTLHIWVRDSGKRPGQAGDESVSVENARLRRENAQLRRANEILKTASADSTRQRNSAWSLSAGVSKSSVFLGLEFSRAAMTSRSAWVRSFMLTPLGKY